MATIKNPEGVWGILTGDIVKSSQLSQDEQNRLTIFFYNGFDTLQGLMPINGKIYGPQIFRGDSWQMAIFPAKLSLRSGVFLRAMLKSRFNGTDSRVAIGVGQVMLIIEEFVSAGLGPAFTLSGELLDQMGNRMLLRTQKDHTAKTKIGRSIEIIVRNMDKLITDWTPGQAQAVMGILLGKQQEQIADEWQPKRIIQQAVSAHLMAANWKIISESLQFVESLIDDWENLEEVKSP
jgi:hypothetical protein